MNLQHRNNLKKSKIMTDLGVSEGHVSDLTLQWLQLNGATSSNVNDAWGQYNALQNALPNVNDSWYSWLGDLLHLGALPGRWRSFWAS